MAPPDEVDAEAVVVPAHAAEAVRRRLREALLLDTALQPVRVGGDVLFALDAAADRAVVAHLVAPEAVLFRRARFPRRETRPTGYQDLLSDLPPDARALLPSSFDIVGHIAVLKLPDALAPHKPPIAQAVLEAYRNIETVAVDHGVRGPFRVRHLEVVAGRPELVTVHREHGIEVEVDLARVYFSPRLATERLRLASRVRPGETVVDLFAGVGAFVVLAARTRAPGAVVAIDLNPEAVRLLQRNLVRNRVPFGLVQTVCGDARAAAPRDGDQDHVVMNLPHDAPAFLDVAARAVAPDGEVHLYAIVERADRDRLVRGWADTLSRHKGASWRLVETRHVRTYSPTMDGWGFTFTGAVQAGGPLPGLKSS